MKIGGFQKLTFVDFPGRVACSVFLMGCNFRCPFCYSVEFVLPEEISEHQPISEKEFFNFLKEKRGLIEGVCIGGGEPTVHPDLPKFCEKIKKMGFEVKLDTNGSNPEMLEFLIEKGFVDYVALDLKAPRRKYHRVIGYEGYSLNYILHKIDQSIEILKKERIDYEFRTTFVPGLLTKKDILEIVRWFKPAKKYVLQKFNPQKTIDPKLQRSRVPTQEELFKIQQAISPFVETVKIR